MVSGHLDLLESSLAIGFGLIELLLDKLLLGEGLFGKFIGVQSDAGAHALVVVAGVVLDGADLNLTLFLGGSDAFSNAAGSHALLRVAAFAAKTNLVETLFYVRNLLGKGEFAVLGGFGHLSVDVFYGDGAAGATLLEALLDGGCGGEFTAGKLDFEGAGRLHFGVVLGIWIKLLDC